jgi:hypothetical protein
LRCVGPSPKPPRESHSGSVEVLFRRAIRIEDMQRAQCSGSFSFQRLSETPPRSHRMSIDSCELSLYDATARRRVAAGSRLHFSHWAGSAETPPQEFLRAFFVSAAPSLYDVPGEMERAACRSLACGGRSPFLFALRRPRSTCRPTLPRCLEYRTPFEATLCRLSVSSLAREP